MPSQPLAVETLSDSSTPLTESEIVIGGTAIDTEPFWLSADIEQREARRMAFEAGLRHGAKRALESPALVGIAKQNVLLKTMVDGLAAECVRLEKLAEFWRVRFVQCVKVIGERGA
jgi:hypothetical protein